MLFRITRFPDSLRRALQAAVAAHRPTLLRDLLASHGETVFATALGACSGRVVADALSMLHATERASVSQCLDKDTRARVCQASRISPTADPVSLDGLSRTAMHGLLVRRHPT